MLERIEAAPVTAAARSRESEVAAALPGRQASVVAPAVVAVVVDPVVAEEAAAVVAAEAAGSEALANRVRARLREITLTIALK